MQINIPPKVFYSTFDTFALSLFENLSKEFHNKPKSSSNSAMDIDLRICSLGNHY